MSVAVGATRTMFKAREVADLKVCATSVSRPEGLRDERYISLSKVIGSSRIRLPVAW
jgi:hypothetical protein